MFSLYIFKTIGVFHDLLWENNTGWGQFTHCVTVTIPDPKLTVKGMSRLVFTILHKFIKDTVNSYKPVCDHVSTITSYKKRSSVSVEHMYSVQIKGQIIMKCLCGTKSMRKTLPALWKSPKWLLSTLLNTTFIIYPSHVNTLVLYSTGFGRDSGYVNVMIKV